MLYRVPVCTVVLYRVAVCTVFYRVTVCTVLLYRVTVSGYNALSCSVPKFSGAYRNTPSMARIDFLILQGAPGTFQMHARVMCLRPGNSRGERGTVPVHGM